MISKEKFLKLMEALIQDEEYKSKLNKLNKEYDQENIFCYNTSGTDEAMSILLNHALDNNQNLADCVWNFIYNLPQATTLYDENGEATICKTPGDLYDFLAANGHDDIEHCVSAIARALKEDIVREKEDDLENSWFFKWDNDATPEWNLYKFVCMLDLYRGHCRRWEEHHNGTCNVVERVRDKYLIPKIRTFLAELKAKICR